MKKKAFTLIEVLVVMAILSILVTILAPKGKSLLEAINRLFDRKNIEIERKLTQYKAFINEAEIKTEKYIINKNGIITEELNVSK